MRRVLGSVVVLMSVALTASAAPAASVAPAEDAAARIRKLTDEVFAAGVERFPEQATGNGMTDAPHGRITDNSLEALARWQAREDGWLAAVRQIDGASLAGKPEWPLYGVLREQLESSVAKRICRKELWDVDSYQEGWQAVYSDLARQQPVGSAGARAAALARLRALPAAVDVDIANLHRGVAQGYTAPKVIVRSVITQLDGLLATPAASSPFASPAQRDPEPAFRAEYLRLIEKELYPAMRRYRSYLAGDYLAAARETLGVSAIPHGVDCYRASVRSFATVDRSPDEVYSLGLRQMERIEGEMKIVAERDFATGDVRGLLARLGTDPQYTFRSGDEMIAMAEAALKRAQEAMPRAFLRLPKAGVIVEPYPEFRQKAGAPGQYGAAPDDGSRPAIFNINPYQPEKQSRSDVEPVTFHETLPGHHLQVGRAKEQTSAHPLLRYSYNSGYGEGWALYAEQLADEMGLYSSPVARMGMLQSDAVRAARLVIDSGIHTKGWSREQAVEYLRSHSTKSPGVVEGEVDRYISWPGQATSYMIGKLEILRLRDEAKKALGDRFDLKEFHERVLENGAVTLPMLEEAVRRWIAGPRNH